jgi:hypothetical protein
MNNTITEISPSTSNHDLVRYSSSSSTLISKATFKKGPNFQSIKIHSFFYTKIYFTAFTQLEVQYIYEFSSVKLLLDS